MVNYNQSQAAHEGDIFMSLPLIILAVFSIFFGYITKDIFIGLGSDFFSDNSIFIHPKNESTLNTEFALPTLYKLLPFYFTILFSISSILFLEKYPKFIINFKFSNLGYKIFGFLNQRFLVEMFYNKYISGPILFLGGQTTKVMDKGSVEKFGPFGLEKSVFNISSSINKLSTGLVTSYGLYILVGLIYYVCILYITKSYEDSFLFILVIFSIIDIKYIK